MIAKNREKFLKYGAIGMVALLLLDYAVISPALAHWDAQSDSIHELEKKVTRGEQLIDREDTIRNRWAAMQRANLPKEVSAAENLAFQAIGRWVSASHISVSSLMPDWQTHDEGYETLEFRASAVGTQATIGRFFYEMETDKVPVNLEEYEISTRDEHGSLLNVTARFTFLRLNSAAKTP
jgi:hypothetical protein